MAITTNIEVLKEMVRLAESRRSEALQSIERVNRYNLALTAFSGSFLSLLVTTEIPIIIPRIAGICLIFSVFSSLIALIPRTIKNGAITIDSDVKMIRSGHNLPYDEYLLLTAEITDIAADSANQLSHTKKSWTIYSALFLAISLFIAYFLYAIYA